MGKRRKRHGGTQTLGVSSAILHRAAAAATKPVSPSKPPAAAKVVSQPGSRAGAVSLRPVVAVTPVPFATPPTATAIVKNATAKAAGGVPPNAAALISKTTTSGKSAVSHGQSAVSLANQATQLARGIIAQAQRAKSTQAGQGAVATANAVLQAAGLVSREGSKGISTGQAAIDTANKANASIKATSVRGDDVLSASNVYLSLATTLNQAGAAADGEVNALNNQVAQLQNQISTMQQQASDAGLDPGTAGGGGGGSSSDSGGDDSDSGQSQAVQDFRQTGQDPFDDDGGDTGGGSGGDNSDGAYADTGDTGQPDSGYVDPSAQGTFDEGGVATDDDGNPLPDDNTSMDEAKAWLDTGEDAAELDSEMMAGIDFKWYDVFNPAGGVIRNAVESQQAPDARGIGIPGSWGQHQSFTAVNTGNSAIDAAKLTQAKARLAAVQAARLSTTIPAPYVPTSAFGPSAAVDPSVDPSADSSDDVQGDGEDGFEMQETDDFYIPDQHQITDAEPDYERAHGSIHRGAAYLQEITYPPFGSSSGEQGGSMQPETQIDVLGAEISEDDIDVMGQEDIDVFGVNDIAVLGASYTRGLDVLGASAVLAKKAAPVPQRAGFVLKKSPATGRSFTSLQVSKPKRKDHKTSIKNARDVAKRAAQVSANLQKAIAKSSALVAKRAGKSTSVHGVAVASKHIKVTLPKLRLFAQHLAKASKKLSDNADKHQHAVSVHDAKVKAGTQAVQAKMNLHVGQRAQTKVHGLEEAYEETVDVLGAYLDVIFGDDANPPDPNNPGYLADGSADPAYSGGTDDASVAAALAPGGDPTYGVGPQPTRDTVIQELSQNYPTDANETGGYAQDQTFYSSDGSVAPGTPLPDGAIFYDGSHGFNYDEFTSYNRAANRGGNADGYWFTGGNAPQGPDSNNMWVRRIAGGDAALTGNNAIYLDRVPSGPSGNWGPLVGNWNAGDWVKGLRYDYGKKQWFWYFDMAPDWAKQPDVQVQLNQDLLDWQTAVTAAKTDAAAQAAQDQLDAQTATETAKAQAAQDAVTAHNQQQDQQQAQSDAQIQSTADATSFAQAQQQQQIQAAEDAAQADIEAKAYLAQAQVDQQAAETAARLSAQDQTPYASMDDDSFAQQQAQDSGDSDANNLSATDDSSNVSVDDTSMEGEGDEVDISF